MIEEQIIAECERKIAAAREAIARRADPDEDMREILQALYDAEGLAVSASTPFDRVDQRTAKALRAVAPLLIAKFGWKKHDGSKEAPEDAFLVRASCPVIATSGVSWSAYNLPRSDWSNVSHYFPIPPFQGDTQ